MEFKPTIFIGSSKEGVSVAKMVEAGLKGFADCKMWTDAFLFNKSNYDNLSSQIAFYDYAILIATGDDLITSRKFTAKAIRDNILFEFGLFAGGLGQSRAFFLLEEGTKLPSDLGGITLPYIPKRLSPNFQKGVKEQVDKIMEYIIDKEKTFDMGFIPSTTLAYGYFINFIEKTVERLLEDKQEGKVFSLPDNRKFKISSLKVTILIPDDLSDDMFKKVAAKRLKDGWQKLKVDPKHIRDYDFSIDVSKASDGELHLVDIPYTLNALNMTIELYSRKQHLGKSVRETILEYREIRNFKRTLEYLIKRSAITRGIVNIEVVNI